MPLEQDVPPISGFTLRLFTRIVRRYFRSHFRSVMAQHAERLAAQSGPLIVYANHSSWWDPMISILLAQTLLPSCRHYAPMDADALARYPILRKLGIFPVEMTTARGAAQFLRTGCAILREGGVLWITPQGRFADPRAWPLAFKPGLAALALRVPEATILPLAIEYTFWDERLPEALLHVAEAVTLETGSTTESATKQLETALGVAMLSLQKASIARDPHAFRPLLQGRRGTGGFYAFGRRLRAMLGGRKIQEDHTRRDKS
jgi:1-acyl-sn-glycerol-3-phosphate acyltransferase